MPAREWQHTARRPLVPCPISSGRRDLGAVPTPAAWLRPSRPHCTSALATPSPFPRLYLLQREGSTANPWRSPWLCSSFPPRPLLLSCYPVSSDTQPRSSESAADAAPDGGLHARTATANSGRPYLHVSTLPLTHQPRSRLQTATTPPGGVSEHGLHRSVRCVRAPSHLPADLRQGQHRNGVGSGTSANPPARTRGRCHPADRHPVGQAPTSQKSSESEHRATAPHAAAAAAAARRLRRAPPAAAAAGARREGMRRSLAGRIAYRIASRQRCCWRPRASESLCRRSLPKLLAYGTWVRMRPCARHAQFSAGNRIATDGAHTTLV